MSWRERAGPASFRGVQFRVEVNDLGGGRKTVAHEYPLRDLPFVEDLGLRGRSITIDAYVVGNDYIEQRDALIEALEKPGPGKLALPYIDVATRRFVVTRFNVSERREEGGFAAFVIDFLESQQQPPFPVDAPDIQAAAERLAADTMPTLAADFLAHFDVKGAPSFSLRSLASVVTSATAAVEKGLARVTGVVGAVTSRIDQARDFAAGLKQKLDNITLDADKLVRSPFVAAARFRDVFEAIFKSPALPARNIEALLEAYEFVPALPPPKPVTTTRAREAANYQVLQTMIQRMALVTAARFAPSATYESYEQAVAARDQIADRLDEQIASADDEAFTALVELRAALVKAVPGERSDLPRLLSFTPPVSLPSLVLAHRLYGDVDKELDLVARNRVRHPGFVPGGRELEVLSDA